MRRSADLMTNFKEKLGEELYNQVSEKLDVGKIVFNDDGKKENF